jgi:DNA invertase Pin-like site-specific DNA recombinase
MPKITKIEPEIKALPQRKKVAAYARVSMETEKLHHSLSAQVSYYSALIQKNPEWEYAGVYADEGISGTSTVKRPEFQRMLADCEAGKIDIILTKSISRFARNTVDLLETVRHLKELGIEVRFEKEHINSLSGDGEVMLTLLASFAQSESESISTNVKWGIRKRMQAGMPDACGHFQIYGYRWEGDTLVPVPEEAAVVRRIFQNFLDGKSRLETERELAAEGITTRQGCQWEDSNIKKILENITYTGNMLFQKEFTSDPIEKHRRKNRGELPQYYVEDTHEAIISKETFDYVQSEMARRRELGCFANKALTLNCFSTRIKCGRCGRSFVRSTRRNRAKMSRLGEKYTFWTCTTHKKNNCPVCDTGIIREDVLKEECAKVLGIPEFDEDVFSERVRRITIPEAGTMLFEFIDGSELEHHWERNAKKESWTPECRKRASDYRRTHPVTRDDITCFTTKIRCEHCGCNYRKQTQVMADGHRNAYWRCADRKRCTVKGLRDDHIREIAAEVLGLEAFDENVFLERVDHISVRDGTHLTFHFTDGTTTVREYEYRKEGRTWSDEHKEQISRIMKSKVTPESREEASRQMKRIRSEKKW